MFESISQLIADSDLRPIIIDWLMNVPGLPPILQSVHILCVAVIVASAGFIQLRMLGLAVPSQNLSEMYQRLLPWFSAALCIALLSGAPLVIARPDRYFYNPVAGWKLICGACLILSMLILFLYNRVHPGYWQEHARQRWIGRVLALFSLSAMIGTILAGRWIAYVDYLYWD